MNERTRLSYKAMTVTLSDVSTEDEAITFKVYAGIDPSTAVTVEVDRSIFWGQREGRSTSFMDRLDKGPVDRTELFQVGHHLGEMALPLQTPPSGGMSVRERFTAAYAAAEAKPDGAVRVQLVVSDAELAQLPWEYMAIKGQGGWSERHFLGLRRRVSVVRTGSELARSAVRLGSAVNVVALLASPKGSYRRLDLDKDRTALENAMRGFASKEANPIHLSYVEPPTVPALASAIGDTVDFFYFGGHGRLQDDSTNLILVDSQDVTKGDPYSATLLGQLLADRGTRLAFLGACDTGRSDGHSPWGGAADELIKAQIPFVIAFQASVLDTAASVVAAKIWEYTIQGYAIDQAMAIARGEILQRFRDSPAEWGKPVLYLASGAGDQLFSSDLEPDRKHFTDDIASRGLNQEFAEWLAERGASAATTIYKSAIAEPTHDLIALEGLGDEFDGADAGNRLASPYRPFKHFSFRERRAFVRTDLTANLEEAFDNSKVLLVHGPAGSGKTSLLLAGLGPRLVDAGHPLIRVAKYEDLRDQLTTDINDLGLVDEHRAVGLDRALEDLEKSPPMHPPVIILDQLEELADPADSFDSSVADTIAALIRSARRGTVRLILATRQEGELYARGLIRDVEAWKSVEVPYMSFREAVDAIDEPRVNLQKTIYYAEEAPEQIATELNLGNEGVQPGLLQVVCNRLWRDTRLAGESGRWVISKPAEGAVIRILATALDDFLDENLAGLSDAAQEVLGSPDLYQTPLWTQLDEKYGENYKEAIERLVQLGLLAKRTQEVRSTEYRYSSPTVRYLVRRSQPWNVQNKLEARDTLESITFDWLRGLLPSRGHILYIAASADQLQPNLEQCTLLIRASLEHGIDPSPWVDRAVELHAAHGATSVVAEADRAGRHIGAHTEESRVIGVRDNGPIEPPPDVGPYTWWSINGDSKNSRLTSGFVGSAHDFGGRLNAALVANGWNARLIRRWRQRHLWAALKDAGRLTRADTADWGVVDRSFVSVLRSRLRISRDRRELGIHSRNIGLIAGVALGVLQAINWLLVGWPSPTPFTDSLGEFFQYLFVGLLLGGAIGLGMQIPKTLGYTTNRVYLTGGVTAFTIMGALLEMSEGRGFWRRPVTVVAMAVAGVLVAAAALWPERKEREQDARWFKPWQFLTAGSAGAGAGMAVLHWLIRLPTEATWNGMLLFAKSRDNYFVIFNQLHDWESPGDQRLLYMSIVNTALAGMILAVAARRVRQRAHDAVEELRRTEQRIPPAQDRPNSQTGD